MPDAYVKFISGGGYQKVADYDYVFDARKLWESGYYRDSGFPPMVLPPESANFNAEFGIGDEILVGPGNFGQYNTGTIASFGDLSPAQTVSGFSAHIPDEINHTDLRQASWLETTLTFFADSDISATFTASENASRTLLTVTDPSLFSGKRVMLSGADLPSATFANQLYYAVGFHNSTPSLTGLLLQTTLGGAFVAWGDAGSGTRTIRVVDTIAEFPWKAIQGWSNTAPTR